MAATTAARRTTAAATVAAAATLGIGDGAGGVGEAVVERAAEGESNGGNARVVAMAIGTGLAS